MRAQPNPAQVVAVVAKGEVELGIFLIKNVVFTAAVGSETKEATAAKALDEYLKGPAAVAIIKSKGMNPN